MPGPSRGTILNTTGTCLTVQYVPCPRQCSATESWRALALTLHKIFMFRSATRHAGSFACLLFCTLGAFHAPKAPVWGQSTMEAGGRGCLAQAANRLLATYKEGPSRCVGPPFLLLHWWGRGCKGVGLPDGALVSRTWRASGLWRGLSQKGGDGGRVQCWGCEWNVFPTAHTRPSCPAVCMVSLDEGPWVKHTSLAVPPGAIWFGMGALLISGLKN